MFKRITHPEGALIRENHIFNNLVYKYVKKMILFFFLLLCLLQHIYLLNQLPAVETWMNIICDQTHPLVVELKLKETATLFYKKHLKHA